MSHVGGAAHNPPEDHRDDGHKEPDAEFDRYAAEYDQMLADGIEWSGESAEYFQRYKIRDCTRAFAAIHQRRQQHPDLLDFGAGNGNAIPFWREAWPLVQLTCADVSRRSLELAETRHAGAARFAVIDHGPLPFADQSFDVAFAACVFHHIRHSEHAQTLVELHRVLRADGALMIYEHNPHNPLTRRVVRDCPFDRDAHLVDASTMRSRLLNAGFRRVEVRYRVFFPHLLRALRRAEDWLGWLPLGAQYYAIGWK
jgi:ubiquinone/menaquinone biosynthesis C-methylase UbiE